MGAKVIYTRDQHPSRFLEEVRALEAHIKAVEKQIQKQKSFLALELQCRIPEGTWVKAGGEFLGKVKEFSEEGVVLEARIFHRYLGGFYSYRGYIQYKDEEPSDVRVVSPDSIEEAGVYACSLEGCEKESTAYVQGDATRLWCLDHAIWHGARLNERDYQKAVDSGEIMPVTITFGRGDPT